MNRSYVIWELPFLPGAGPYVCDCRLSIYPGFSLFTKQKILHNLYRIHCLLLYSITTSCNVLYMYVCDCQTESDVSLHSAAWKPSGRRFERIGVYNNKTTDWKLTAEVFPNEKYFFNGRTFRAIGLFVSRIFSFIFMDHL